MRKLVLGIVMLLFILSLSSAQAGPYDRLLCPPGTGTFFIDDGRLAVTIVKENGKPVTPHTEQLSNPLTGKDAEAVTAQGLVVFNSHVDKESGRLFVHWETVKQAK